MKKINILTLGLLASAAILTGCGDSFLEQEPPTKETVDEYFSNEKHIQEQVNSCYAAIRVYDYYVDATNEAAYSPLIFSDVMGDDMLVGSNGPTDQLIWHLAAGYNSNENQTLWPFWGNSYNGIRAANDVISSIENNRENLSADFAAKVEAEARVMRAFYYSIVWKYFGNIPYFTSPLSSNDRIEQSAPATVYENIVSDLEGAIEMKALPMSYGAGSQADEAQLGRATQALAYMIYADLVLYQNDQSRFAKALSYMKEIINSGLYALDPDYAHLWLPDGEWGTESIFEVNYFGGSSSGRDYPDAQDVYKMSNYNPGGTILPRVISPETPTSDGIQDGWGTFVPRKSVYEELFARNDKRRDATCYVAPEGSYKLRYQDQGLFLNKYIGHDYNVDANTGGAPDMHFNNNLRIYRYAETLLFAAELQVRSNGGNDPGDLAKGWLKQVRDRAGLVTPTEPTVENIITERRKEFVGEGKRYWDLVRMDGATDVVVSQTASKVLKKETAFVNDKDASDRQQDWKPSKKYLPIPLKEISASDNALQQNTAYFE